MPRICYITGQGTKSGQTRSHSMRAGKRTFKKNLVYRWVDLTDGTKMRIKVSTKMYKKLRGFV